MDQDTATSTATTTTGTSGGPGDRADGGGDTRSVLPGLLASAAAVAVLAVGAVVLLGTVLADEDDPVLLEREGRLSAEAYSAVELGANEDAVLTALRPVLPTDTRVVERYDEREPETVSAECVYYDREDGRAGQQYRFCFVEDVLVDKTVVLAGDPGEGSAVVDEGAVDG